MVRYEVLWVSLCHFGRVLDALDLLRLPDIAHRDQAVENSQLAHE